MNDETKGPTSTDLPDGWNRPRPEHLPAPTLAPATLALGATLLLWGIVTSIIIVIVGAALTAGGLAVWIREIRHERKQH